jgi:hypothetical protein
MSSRRDALQVLTTPPGPFDLADTPRSLQGPQTRSRLDLAVRLFFIGLLTHVQEAR